jgi:aldose 1-epimerase
LKKEIFGKVDDGREVFIFTLKNENEIEIKVINYGGIITSMIVKDKDNNYSDIVLGFDKLDDYLKPHSYFGAIIGRFANRIANGKFKINDTEIQLAKNDGNNHLFGGVKGFDKVLWDYEIVEENPIPTLKLKYLSKDGEENYPGNLNVVVSYSLNDDDELKIEYQATTDKETIVNLTNHTYFNLSGEETILSHQLKLDADSFTPINSELLPTGEIRSVVNTPFDFRDFHEIGERIEDKDDQLILGKGYDHNFIINSKNELSLKQAAEVYEPKTGRSIKVYTTQPAVQFYSGNFLDGTYIGKQGRVYKKRAGFCLETQHYPDSPNQSSFPSVFLKPGEQYYHFTIFKFGIK